MAGLLWIRVFSVLSFAVFALGNAAPFVYTDVSELGVWGRAFGKTASEFHRLPDSAQSVVSSSVWELSTDTAGMYVEFVTDSSSIAINCSLTSASTTMWHFPSTGVAGLDLYSWDNATEAWRWVGTTHTIAYPNMKDILVSGLQAESRRYRLNLPLYNGIKELSIGVESHAQLKGAQPARRHPGSIVWYGTSILQGGVASRPGQAFTNIISRDLGVEIYNFGFSGHGLMELNVAQYLASIEDVSVFIIDCNPNMNGEEIRNRTVPLVQYLHQQQPKATIVLAEGTTYGQAWYNAEINTAQQEKREALQNAYTKLNGTMPAGSLKYVRGNDLMCADPPACIQNPTVGGTHPTDLGMRAIAGYYKKFLPTVLKEANQRLKRNVPELRTSSKRSLQSGPSRSASQQEEWLRRAEHTHRSAPANSAALEFTDLRTLTVRGRAFNDTSPFFSRLPTSAEKVVRSQVWELSQFATGINVVFVTDSSAIYLNYTLTHVDNPLWHMPMTGTSGCDLYMQTKVNGTVTWRWVGTVRQFAYPNSQLTELAGGLPEGKNTYALFLPMRNSLAEGAIGVLPGSFIGPLEDYTPKPPVVWYGTSICQGGAVSRAGMTYTNILTQLLGTHEVWNFGFAGNGKMEINVAEFLTQINAAAFVIDCNPNLNAESISKLAKPLVQYFRKQHPTTPIILAEGTTYGDFWFQPGTHSGQVAKRQALRTAYNELKAAGDEHLHYVDGNLLFGNNSVVNPTVGGTHPSDLGHYDIASFYLQYLPTILGESP